MGASAGLTVTPPATAAPSLQDYVYNEIGYLATANCMYNTSPLWHIDDRQDVTGEASEFPVSYLAEGCFPNSNFNKGCHQDYFAQVALGSTTQTITAMGGHNSGDRSEHYIAIAAGDDYLALNQTQYQILFKPTNFTVNVSFTNSTIRVTQTDGEGVIDPEPVWDTPLGGHRRPQHDFHGPDDTLRIHGRRSTDEQR